MFDVNQWRRQGAGGHDLKGGSSDDQVQDLFFANVEPEPAFGSRERLNPEPEPQVQVHQVRFEVRTHSDAQTA
jgi:hypothetical protein